MYLIKFLNLPSCVACWTKALGNTKQNNIKGGKYFSVDKIIKENIIKLYEDNTLNIHTLHYFITTGLTVECAGTNHI